MPDHFLIFHQLEQCLQFHLCVDKLHADLVSTFGRHLRRISQVLLECSFASFRACSYGKDHG